MTQEERQLLLVDLCARQPYRTKIDTGVEGIAILDGTLYELNRINLECSNDVFLPYLRPMSSMTEEEAMKVAELWGFKDILSISVKENYISVELDDGVAGSETYTIWFKEMVSSIELFDWLNSHYFDYRGLIPRGLALEAPEDMYKVK